MADKVYILSIILLGTARQCFRLCRHLCSAVEGVVAITFDSRNHGDRIVDSLRNRDWASDPINKTFPADMYSLMLGNVYDIQLLIDMLPMYMHLREVTFGVVGLSLGAHSALLTIANISQIKFAISVLGCADYEKLLTYRSQLTEFSQDFDVSQSLRLLLSEYDPIYRIDRLAGKSILLLGGRKDELVPPFLNAQFIELANQKQIDCEEMIDVDAAHELSTRMNQKITEWLQKHF